jgi:hypothetical protein
MGIQFEPARRPDLQTFNEQVIQCQDQAYLLACLYLGDERAAGDLVQAAVREMYAAKNMIHSCDFQTEVFRRITCHLQGYPPPAADRQTPRLDRSASENCLPPLLLRLSPACRLAVILVDCLGLDYAGAAQAAGASLGQLRSELAQGRVQLARLIRGRAV